MDGFAPSFVLALYFITLYTKVCTLKFSVGTKFVGRTVEDAYPQVEWLSTREYNRLRTQGALGRLTLRS